MHYDSITPVVEGVVGDVVLVALAVPDVVLRLVADFVRFVLFVLSLAS